MTPIHSSKRPKAAEALLQASFLLLTVFTCSGVLVLLGSYLTNAVWGYSLLKHADDLGELSDKQFVGFKVTQVFYSLGTFVLPAIIFLQFFRIKAVEFWGLNKQDGWKTYALVALLWVVVYPFINWTHEINAAIDFEALGGLGESLKETASGANEATERMLNTRNVGAFVLNLLIVGLLPALGEEMLFRGVVQKLFIQWSRNGHIAIWVSAILFSAMHLQFDGFIPRTLLGAIFGYVFWWTGNLKLTIFMHFVNNATMVVLAFAFGTDISIAEPEDMGWALGISSLLLSLPILYIVYRSSRVKSLKVLRHENNITWVKLYETMNVYRANILHDSLREQGYNAVMVNKNDSAYGTFGAVELYVPDYERESAQLRINEIGL